VEICGEYRVPIKPRRRFPDGAVSLLQTLVVVVIVMTASVVVVIQIAVQIFLGRVFVRAPLLDFRLLTSRRSEVAILNIFALFLPVMMDIALILTDRARVVAHVLVVRRVRER
jgi:hypothetical protein